MGTTRRAQALLGVDELIGNVFGELEAQGIVDNTYFFFSSDNGYHLGQCTAVHTAHIAHTHRITASPHTPHHCPPTPTHPTHMPRHPPVRMCVRAGKGQRSALRP